MIQTTIQNSCAVDGYKRSRDAASARRPEGLCGRGSLPRLSPRQAQSCGLRHVCPFPKRNMQKKKKTNKPGWGKESKERQTRSDCTGALAASLVLFLAALTSLAAPPAESPEPSRPDVACRPGPALGTPRHLGARPPDATPTLVAGGPAPGVCRRTRGDDRLLGRDWGCRGPSRHAAPGRGAADPGPGV